MQELENQKTPITQKLKAKMTGHLWGAIGLVLAVVVMALRGIWYFALFMTAMIYLQYWEYKGARQSYEGAAKMEEELMEEKLKEL